MIRIGNGYLGNGKYSPLLGAIVGHWITVWGYDDNEKVFCVYDSAVPKHLYDDNIPVGNKKRSYSEILRDWRGALLVWPWRFAYIKIEITN